MPLNLSRLVGSSQIKFLNLSAAIHFSTSGLALRVALAVSLLQWFRSAYTLVRVRRWSIVFGLGRAVVSFYFLAWRLASGLVLVLCVLRGGGFVCS